MNAIVNVFITLIKTVLWLGHMLLALFIPFNKHDDDNNDAHHKGIN